MVTEVSCASSLIHLPFLPRVLHVHISGYEIVHVYTYARLVTDRDRDRDSGRDRETWDGGRNTTYKQTQTQTQTQTQKFDGEKEASLLHHGGGKKSGRERDTPPEVASLSVVWPRCDIFEF